MKKSLPILFLTVLLISLNYSCSNNTSDDSCTNIIVVNLSNDPIKISTLFSEPKLVFLKPGLQPIGKVTKLKVYNDTIYILSNLQIFIYDKNGSFIRVFNKSGRGPGEYLNLFDFYVDKSGIIEVLDFRGKRIVKYDNQGNYLDEWKIGMYGLSFSKIENNYILYGGNENTVTEFGENMVYIFNKWKGHVIKEFISVDDTRSRFLNYVDMRNIQLADNGAYIAFSPSDTIYLYKEGKFSSKIFIDFGKKRVSQQVYNKSFDDIIAFNSYLVDKDLCHFIYNYLVTPELILFNFLYKGDYWLGTYDLLTKLGFCSDTMEDDLIFRGNTYKTQEFFPLEYYDGYYYFILQPYQITDYIKENGLQNINELTHFTIDSLQNIKIEDNPIIVMLRKK